uniref:I/LWEQ domain-containing protein n=1 Tax=Timema genevievae TaxID=629358 RepID=A0A7R9JVZ6_TIMGE|nr:unnamed protein product [Timema genevievae]
MDLAEIVGYNTAADKVVRGEGKFEQLMVASQEIAASTAQLVVASRVKAERNSANLGALSQASKGVTQATGVVVATSKSCSEMVEESEDLDVSGLSLHQAKRLEMESQVRVLELEANLQKERERLATLRRQHYRLAGELEGWEQQFNIIIDVKITTARQMTVGESVERSSRTHSACTVSLNISYRSSRRECG